MAPLLQHSPFENAARKSGLELRFDAQPKGFDPFKRNAIKAVQPGAERARPFDGPPLLTDAIKQFPGIRRAAAALAGIIEPVNLHARNFARLDELILHPLGSAAMIPPRETRNARVARSFGQLAIDHRLDRIIYKAV